MEAAKLRCKIYHGPYVYNFNDIYEILKNNNISFVINNYNELSNYLKNDFELQNKDKSKTSEIIKELGNKTLVDTLKNINRFMFNESIKPKFWSSKKGIIPYFYCLSVL